MYTHGIDKGKVVIYRDEQKISFAEVCARLNETENLEQEILSFRAKLDPDKWTTSQNVAWHRYLPNVRRSFHALLES